MNVGNRKLSELFGGGGQAKDLFRRIDWNHSPLGPPDSWPERLVNAVELMLDSSFPIALSWGSEHVVLYNDAMIPLIGPSKHPRAFARPLAAAWYEAADDIAPLLDQVLNTGRSVRRDDQRIILDRFGYLEECYFTYSHSPVKGNDGTCSAVFTVVTETTRHVVHERRIGLLRDLGGLAVTAATSLEDTCTSALAVLEQTRATVPFAAAFLRACGSMPAGGPITYGLTAGQCPDPHGPGAGVADGCSLLDDFRAASNRAIDTGRTEVLDGLRARYPGVLQPGPLGPITPDAAVVLPLRVSGRRQSIGAVVLGVNPYRRLDEKYRTFYELAGHHLNVALTDALAYQEGQERATALAELDQAKNQFFQNVSHELRTPLTLLLAPLHDLATDAELRLSDDQSENIKAAFRGAQRLERLVDGFLDFSRAEAGVLHADRADVDLSLLTTDVATMHRSAAEEAGLSYQIEVPASALRAHIDPDMWVSIVDNLLSNAVKFTEQGEIVVSLHARGNDIELIVRDTGIGIRRDEQDLVFDRFQQSAHNDVRGGTGIGLSLVRDLTESLGGSVRVDSELGVGTRFTVIVPRRADGATIAASAPGRAAPGGIALSPVRSAPAAGKNATQRPRGDVDAADGPMVGRRILLVEDDGDTRAYLRRLLRSDGWTVDAVGDAEAALALLAAGSTTELPHVVLTDLMLPGSSGLDLVTALRTNEPTSRLPVVLLTARVGVEAAVKGLSAGADDYITKPFSPEELLARLRVHDELARRREEALGRAQSRAEQLKDALDSNRTIGTAVGIVMSRYRLTAAQSFSLLVEASQFTNTKLRNLASRVIDHRSLPVRPTVLDELLSRLVGGSAAPVERGRR
jgi:signal transduction histidine kinase/DNA-binding response OmpR family regulator